MIKPEVREAVFAAYGRNCLRCGSDFKLAVDHVVPTSRGGSDDASNLQPLCKRCNSSKNAKDTDYRPAILPLHIQPAPPKKTRTKRVEAHPGMKSVLVRFPDELYAAVAAQAQAERRSVTAQILVCIEQCTQPPKPATLPGGASMTTETKADYPDKKTDDPT